MTNPLFTSLVVPQDGNAGWQPKPVNTDTSAATGSDPSGYTRAVMRDGQFSHSETGKASLGSSGTAVQDATAAAKVPYETALDPATRCRVAPDQVKDETILYFPGRGEVTARDARALGWLSPTPSSAQPTPTGETPNRPADAPQEDTNPDLQGEAFTDATAEQGLTNIVNSTGGMEQMTAIQEIISTGEVGQNTLATLASQMAIEPEQLQQQFAPVMQAFEQQARAVMSEGGLDSNDVVAWAQQHKPDMLQRAMHKQATMRSTSGYATLRQEYLESMADHSPSVALNADLGPGFSQRQDSKGRVIVRLPNGSEVEWRHAIKAFGPGKR